MQQSDRETSSGAVTRFLVAALVSFLTLAHVPGAWAESQQDIQIQIDDVERQQRRLVQEFMSYAIDNPLSTACSVAGMSGTATMFMREVDPSLRDTLQGAAVLCAPYCLFVESATCVTTAKMVTALITQYGLLGNRANTLRQRMRSVP